jgi:hypothetical protein
LATVITAVKLQPVKPYQPVRNHALQKTYQFIRISKLRILQLESVLVAALTPTCSAFFRSLGILGGVVGLTAADPQRSWSLGGHGEHGRRQALA